MAGDSDLRGYATVRERDLAHRSYGPSYEEVYSPTFTSFPWSPDPFSSIPLEAGKTYEQWRHPVWDGEVGHQPSGASIAFGPQVWGAVKSLFHSLGGRAARHRRSTLNPGEVETWGGDDEVASLFEGGEYGGYGYEEVSSLFEGGEYGGYGYEEMVESCYDGGMDHDGWSEVSEETSASEQDYYY